LAAAGLFAGCYRLGGAWLDIARVDSLFLALMFWGLVTARRARSTTGWVVTGTLLSLAFLTKQLAVVAVPAVLPWAIHAGRRHVVALLTTIAIGMGASTFVLDRLADGWYRVYVFDLLAGHHKRYEIWTSFLTHDLARPLALALVLGGVACWSSRASVSVRWFVVPVVVALIAMAFVGRVDAGGYDNVLLPAFGAAAILFGLAVAAISRWQPPVHWWRSAALAACVAQLAVVIYNPVAQIPTATDHRAGAHLLEELRALPGAVYLPDHGWYMTMVGKARNVQCQAMLDVSRGGSEDGGPRLAAELSAAIERQQFDYIVLDRVGRIACTPPNLRTYYRPWRPLARAGTELLPLTGLQAGPTIIWVRVDLAPCPAPAPCREATP
jgi:hypothetical protein